MERGAMEEETIEGAVKFKSSERLAEFMGRGKTSSSSSTITNPVFIDVDLGELATDLAAKRASDNYAGEVASLTNIIKMRAPF